MFSLDSWQKLVPVLVDKQHTSGSGTEMLLFPGSGGGSPISPPVPAARCMGQRMQVFLPPLEMHTPFLLSLPPVVVLTCGQAPCGHESVPMLLWVTLSVLHLAPCSLAARAVGRDTLRAASTLGTPYGNSGLLHTTQQAGCPPASQPSCPGSPPSREPILCLCFCWGCGGCGHPHTPHLGS